jgi:CBS domain-containing protein
MEALVVSGCVLLAFLFAPCLLAMSNYTLKEEEEGGYFRHRTQFALQMRRDLMAKRARDEKIAEATPRVAAVMMPKPYYCHDYQSIEEAREIMRIHDVEILPVKDLFGRVVGTVSRNDLAKSN